MDQWRGKVGVRTMHRVFQCHIMIYCGSKGTHNALGDFVIVTLSVIQGQTQSSCLQLRTYLWGHQPAASAFKELCAGMKDRQADSDSL